MTHLNYFNNYDNRYFKNQEINKTAPSFTECPLVLILLEYIIHKDQFALQ